MLRISLLVFLTCLGGIALLAGAVEVTNTQTFCTSCHVMDDVTASYRASVHGGRNASGLRAKCADCHVTPGVLPTLRSKLRSIPAELIPWLQGVDTPAELAARREELARAVWDHLHETDSAACRSCHEWSPEVLSLQATRARAQHEDGERDGETCIACHDDGIAHDPVEKDEKEGEEAWEEQDFTL